MIDVTKEIKLVKRGLLSFESINYLFDLYLPIIGSEASFLYLFLANKVKEEELNVTISELVKESSLSLQTFLLAKKSLESIGLISFYEKKGEESYLLLVNDLYTPKNFFDNLIYKGLLVNNLGEEKAHELIKKYSLNIDLSSYEDISSKIDESFTIDFNMSSLDLDSGVSLEGRSKNEIRDNFSDVKLFNYLNKNTQIRAASLTDQEIDTIHKIATLYGLNENRIGALVSEAFIPEAKVGSKVDFIKLKRDAKAYVRSFKVSKNKTEKKTFINSESDIANLIRYYESISPRDFLMGKQNGVEVSDADKNLLEELSLNLGLSNGIINALLDYVLKVKDGELSRNYILKIATTLIRKGCKNTLDCLNMLNKNVKTSNKVSVKKEEIKVEKEEVKEEEPTYDFTEEEAFI